VRDRLQHAEGELGDVLDALRRYRQIHSEVETLRMELRACIRHKDDIALSVFSRRDDGQPRGQGGHSDPTMRAAEVIMEQCAGRERYILDAIRALMEERNAVDELLERLDSTERKITRMRWIQMKNWVSIAFAAELSDRQCQRIHRKALQKMAQWHASMADEREKGKTEKEAEMSLHVG